MRNCVDLENQWIFHELDDWDRRQELKLWSVFALKVHVLWCIITCKSIYYAVLVLHIHSAFNNQQCQPCFNIPNSEELKIEARKTQAFYVSCTLYMSLWCIFHVQCEMWVSSGFCHSSSLSLLLLLLLLMFV